MGGRGIHLCDSIHKKFPDKILPVLSFPCQNGFDWDRPAQMLPTHTVTRHGFQMSFVALHDERTRIKLVKTLDEMMENVYASARSNLKTVVLPESSDPRTIKAVEGIRKSKAASVILIGNPDEVRASCREHGVDPDFPRIIDPETSDCIDAYASTYHELRKAKGVTLDQARSIMRDPLFFATMMIYDGSADGFVSGAIHTTGETVRPALQIIKTRPGSRTVSSVFFMGIPDRLSIFADCAINPCPSAEELAEIAIDSARTAQAFGMEPKVGLISFSTAGSASHPLVDKVIEATRIAKDRAPDLSIEGEMQFDAAFVPEVGRKKFPGSKVAGEVNVFVFPDLQVGNTVYKAVQRIAGVDAVGPLLQGLRKPVNDLSRGCSVEDIVNLVVLTAVQAQSL